jgi:peptide/nickel transport system permease protein
VTFQVQPGECLGVVGESGCGKSITGAAVLGLLPPDAFVSGGTVEFDGQDLAASSEEELRRLRGKRIAFVSQEPMIGLDPAFRIGAQLGEIVRVHHPDLSKAQVKGRVLDLLRDVRLHDPEKVAKSYPHELSGGMAQRVSIARALAGNPALLIADEPTTALDVTVQAEILDLFKGLRREHDMAVVIITHDWGVIAQLCDRAIVMYGGQVVESASVVELFRAAAHPYTAALLASNPHGAPQGSDLPSIPGAVPPPGSWPDGCRFRDRCPFATEVCEHGRVDLVIPAPGRQSRCRRVEEVISW